MNLLANTPQASASEQSRSKILTVLLLIRKTFKLRMFWEWLCQRRWLLCTTAFQNKSIKKFLTIPNALNKKDTEKSKIIFKKRISNFYLNTKPQYKFVYFGNVQSQKGIHQIIDAIKRINEEFSKNIIKIDIYGMRFETFLEIKNQIEYKGLKSYQNRVEVLSKYDFL